ncbi:uncharacterized protein LOC126774413 isoform X1 [Nymphalis io]|uniref:uncharacterized protein LOC126774413 isoform X1 n=1 Tax=Inachis io TaxID=171585 RepID=UPI002168BA1C|nr:uncharacterized protein LOC126774413 isoform X1 [Nymphalis io]
MHALNCFSMKHLYITLFLILISVVYHTIASQCEVAQVCVNDLSQAECGAGLVLTQNFNIFGCCPGCKLASEDGNNNNNTDVTPAESCRPPSTCLPDGRYAPVQCKGDLFVGRCFCSDDEGNRIFGQMWRRDASEMTCACSRRRHELEKSRNKMSTLHCTSTGDYEPLQCDDGMCWCANPKTGQPTVAPLPESDMSMLPCYSASVVGENYLRRCESIVYSLATIKREQEEHGTFFLGNPITFCDYDGSYGPYQIQNGIAYCTGRDGKILGSWQVVVSEMTGMTCNCARDTNIYFPEKGMSVAEVCQPNGNYRPSQNAGNVPYCVDSDGYHIENREDWPEECIRNAGED